MTHIEDIKRVNIMNKDYEQYLYNRIEALENRVAFLEKNIAFKDAQLEVSKQINFK